VREGGGNRCRLQNVTSKTIIRTSYLHPVVHSIVRFMCQSLTFLPTKARIELSLHQEIYFNHNNILIKDIYTNKPLKLQLFYLNPFLQLQNIHELSHSVLLTYSITKVLWSSSIVMRFPLSQCRIKLQNVLLRFSSTCSIMAT
jgi:hypothetical protein